MVARNRIVIEGTLGESDNEQWSTSIHYAGEGGAVVEDPAELVSWAQASHEYFGTLDATSTLMGLLSSSGSIRTVTAQYFNTANVLVQQGVSAPNTVAGDSPLRCPFQTSVVMSMRTGLPGASFRGRNYWPGLGATISVDGLLAGSDAGAPVALNWTQLLDAIADASPQVAGPFPMVYSPTRDLLTPVSSVLVGSVPDTQRRRRDALVEVYASAPYPPL